MPHNMQDDVADYLETRIAGTPGVNVFVDRYPDSPDDCIGVYGRPGGPPLTTMTGHGALEETKADQPMLQVLVRAKAYAVGDGFAQAIYRVLHGITETVLVNGGGVFHLIEALHSPAHLGVDEKQRHEWSQNFYVLWENPNR